jgi:hypothetical protein
MKQCLVYKGKGVNITGYVGADWGGDDEQDHRSCNGFVFCHRVEYRSRIAEATKEAMYMKGFLGQMLGEER